MRLFFQVTILDIMLGNAYCKVLRQDRKAVDSHAAGFPLCATMVRMDTAVMYTKSGVYTQCITDSDLR